VDVSDVVPDLNEAFFGSDGIRGLSDVVRERVTAGRLTAFAGERIGAPIARPHQILCIGLNYSDHAAETGAAVPDEPILFTKSPNTHRPLRRRPHPARLDETRLGGRAGHRDRPPKQLPRLR
jgi:2,4-diketo-3-deoxy-L-fuconate hydrolase